MFEKIAAYAEEKARSFLPSVVKTAFGIEGSTLFLRFSVPLTNEGIKACRDASLRNTDDLVFLAKHAWLMSLTNCFYVQDFGALSPYVAGKRYEIRDLMAEAQKKLATDEAKQRFRDFCAKEREGDTIDLLLSLRTTGGETNAQMILDIKSNYAYMPGGIFKKDLVAETPETAINTAFTTFFTPVPPRIDMRLLEEFFTELWIARGGETAKEGFGRWFIDHCAKTYSPLDAEKGTCFQFVFPHFDEDVSGANETLRTFSEKSPEFSEATLSFTNQGFYGAKKAILAFPHLPLSVMADADYFAYNAMFQNFPYSCENPPSWKPFFDAEKGEGFPAVQGKTLREKMLALLKVGQAKPVKAAGLKP